MNAKPLAAALAVLVLQLTASAARAQQTDEVTASAVFLLEQSMQVSRSGRHHTMLLALRHLGDPELTPLFSELAESSNPLLQVHGILGLADCHPDRQLDLVRLAKIDNPGRQAEIIGAAMNSELLTDEQASQLYSWPGIDDGVRVVVATQLVSHGVKFDPEPLKTALTAENEARRALAGLILHQLGDPEGLRVLRAVDASENPLRDKVREMLIETAMRSNFDRAGVWAAQIATEPGVSPKLGLMATQVAMRFGLAEGTEVWRQQFTSATDPAQRIRLALAALRLAIYIDAATFDPLLTSDDPLVVAIGKAGAAVAAKRDIARNVVFLVQQNHPIANDWALRYAKKDAGREDAVQVLMGLILAYDNTKRNSAQLLDDAVSATQVLYELDPATATALLRPIFENENTHPILIQGLLLGLIRCRSGNAAQVIDGMASMGSPGGDALATILRGKCDVPMDAAQLADLGVIVRGGGSINNELRLQAAWAYLKRTGQTRTALAQAIAH